MNSSDSFKPVFITQAEVSISRQKKHIIKAIVDKIIVSKKDASHFGVGKLFPPLILAINTDKRIKQGIRIIPMGKNIVS